MFKNTVAASYSFSGSKLRQVFVILVLLVCVSIISISTPIISASLVNRGHPRSPDFIPDGLLFEHKIIIFGTSTITEFTTIQDIILSTDSQSYCLRIRLQ